MADTAKKGADKVTEQFKAQMGKGRPKGAQNKLTKQVKEMILGALDDAGGQEYLARQADENPVAFMSLVGKVLPMQAEITGKDGGAIKTETQINVSALSEAALREIASLNVSSGD